jgi:hypothetical protein
MTDPQIQTNKLGNEISTQTEARTEALTESRTMHIQTETTQAIKATPVTK